MKGQCEDRGAGASKRRSERGRATDWAAKEAAKMKESRVEEGSEPSAQRSDGGRVLGRESGRGREEEKGKEREERGSEGARERGSEGERMGIQPAEGCDGVGNRLNSFNTQRHTCT